MAGDSAVTPSRDAIMRIKRDLKSVDEEPHLDNEDKAYSEITDMNAWSFLKKFIERKKGSLKPTPNFKGMNDDDFFRNFGIRSLIYEIVSGELDSIIKRVEQSNEAVKEERAKTKRVRKA